MWKNEYGINNSRFERESFSTHHLIRHVGHCPHPMKETGRRQQNACLHHQTGVEQPGFQFQPKTQYRRTSRRLDSPIRQHRPVSRGGILLHPSFSSWCWCCGSCAMLQQRHDPFSVAHRVRHYFLRHLHSGSHSVAIVLALVVGRSFLLPYILMQYWQNARRSWSASSSRDSGTIRFSTWFWWQKVKSIARVVCTCVWRPFPP